MELKRLNHKNYYRQNRLLNLPQDFMSNSQ
jgi:hypothetical protein